MEKMKYPWWVAGDWNAFFGLGVNSLLNILVLSGLLLGVIQMPVEIVFGRIIPAIGFMLFLSNIYYAFMARRLAAKTGRMDVTAMPAGPSVPHMFIVVLVIMLPVKIATGDPIKAWEVGLAWAFIEGAINLSGAFIAPYIRKLTPRAALLGTLAGVSIAFIALRPAQQILVTPGSALSGWRSSSAGGSPGFSSHISSRRAWSPSGLAPRWPGALPFLAWRRSWTRRRWAHRCRRSASPCLSRQSIA